MNFLDELVALPQWCAFRPVWNAKKGRPDKPPHSVITGQYARPNVLADWAGYDAAAQYAMRQGWSSTGGGVGFLFTDGDCYAGIDMDHVIDESGKLKEFASEIVAAMDSYTEYSPSGKGLHILFKLNAPMATFGNRHKDSELGLEMYDTGRYFTVTFNPYGNAKPIAERTEAAKKIYAKYLAKSAAESSKQTPQNSLPLDWRYTPPSTEKLTNSELWLRMFENEKNGAAIRALYNGDKSAYNEDWSAADLALCNHLAFYTGGDTLQMDSMFRESGLMRPKWDELHGGQMYGAMTIAEAIRKTNNYYKPEEYYAAEQYAPMKAASVSRAESPERLQPQEEEILFNNLLAYLENSLYSDIQEFSRYRELKTGYDNIDEKTSLYPGLYVLGAVSSAGKTTFLTQMSDQLARVGEAVLFFSLEQSQLELATKGLARLTAQEDLTSARSSIEIRKGQVTDAVKRAIGEYKKFANHETIIECGFGTSIREITAAVDKYVQETGRIPVVIVDYLQLVQPENTRLTGKDAVDANVAAFKQLQQKYQLVLFLVSSFNRQNYLTIADFESFKESGIIEYSADVVWALQLSIMNSDIFNKKENLKEKRETVKKAKGAVPRHIELVVLKNRYGKANESYYFKYDARYDLFEPSDEATATASDARLEAQKKNRI